MEKNSAAYIGPGTESSGDEGGDVGHSTINNGVPGVGKSNGEPANKDNNTTINKRKDGVVGGNCDQGGDDDDGDDDGEPCGCGPARLRFCQRFRRPGWFIFVLTLFAVCQGMAVNGLVNTVISTLERRFGINSTESGLIASCYDVMFVILVIPVAYFGGHGNKPRYIAVGSFVLGLGSFVFCLPHFISDRYDVGKAQETMCDLQNNGTALDDYCDVNKNKDLSGFKYYFYIGQLLHGAGGTTLFTLAIVYIDENVSQRSSAICNAVVFTGAVVGPCIGFLIGGLFLKKYTDTDVDPDSLGLTTNNPRWVGAWWVGFLMTGTFACLISLPLFAFPSSLPGAKKFAAERGRETHVQKTVDKTGQSKSIRDVLLSIRLLICNIPFMCINLAAAADGILISGFSTFLPKFIEYQYGKTAATSALLVGFVGIPAGGISTLVGGYLVMKFNLKVRGILRLSIIASAITILLMFAYRIKCETRDFAGVTITYGQTGSSSGFLGKQLDSTCNVGCGCVEENYYPVCGRDDVMYFSPCFAGCTSVLDDGDVKSYSDCACVGYNVTSQDVADGNTEMAEFGKCETSCKWTGLFLVLIALQLFMLFIFAMPSLQATLRCVPDHQRSVALGIQWVVARCLGSIPGPILFGKMFDQSCSLWQKKCEGSGACFFYDNGEMRDYLTIVGLVFVILATIFFFMANWFYVPKPYDPANSPATNEVHNDNPACTAATAPPGGGNTTDPHLPVKAEHEV